MSSLLATQASRARLLQLPPSLRSSAYAKSQSQTLPRRNFSASASHRFSFLDAAIAGPTALLDAIHSTGLPWYATLPIAAVLVRCCLTYPLTTRPGRRRAVIRRQLGPLASLIARDKANTDMARFFEEVVKKPEESPPVLLQYLMSRLMFYKHLFFENKRLGAAFGAPLLKWTTFANPILFLAFGEAIRVKAGGKEGLLSLILRPIQRAEEVINDSGPVKTVRENLNPDELLAARLEAAQEAAAANAGDAVTAAAGAEWPSDLQAVGDGAYQLKSLAAQAQEQAQAAMANLDPTMLTEGLLWCQNLTVPDSTMILPALLSGSILLGVFNRDVPKVNTTSKREVSVEQKQPDQDTESSTTVASKKPPVNNAHLDQATIDVNAAFAAADEIRELSKRTKKREDRPLFGQDLTFGQRFQIFMSTVFFGMGMNLPAGVLLYIVPYILSGQLLTRWNNIRNPLPPMISPCRRPMRLKVKKQFKDA